jgi:hypothetical protein
MDRREFLKTAAFTTAGVALAGLTETALLAQPSFADIASGTGDTWGASVQPIGGQSVEDALLALEGMAGRKFDTVHQRMPWPSHLVNRYSSFIADRGQVPILSWFTRGRGGVKWASIAAGQQDDRITAEATALKAAGWPAYFCFHKEPEDEPWMGNAAQWVAAHERVWQIFRSVGVTNATFVATYMAPTFGGANGGLATWAPPHYDLLGADGYNRNLHGYWKPFAKIFTPAHEAASAIGRKLFVIENGCVEGAPGAKAQWYADAAAVAKQWPELIGVSYNHEVGHHGIETGKNYRVDTSQSSIDGFRSVGATTFYNPSQIFYSGSGQTPTPPPPGGGTGGSGNPPPRGSHHKNHHKRHHHKHHRHHGPRTHRKLKARMSRGSSLGS